MMVEADVQDYPRHVALPKQFVALARMQADLVHFLVAERPGLVQPFQGNPHFPDVMEKSTHPHVANGLLLETGGPLGNTLCYPPWSCGGFPQDKVDLACGHRIGPVGFLHSRFFRKKPDFGGNFMEDINRDTEG
jgi:hypothetical protein